MEGTYSLPEMKIVLALADALFERRTILASEIDAIILGRRPSEPLSDVSPQPSLTLRSRSLRQIKAALWKLNSPCTMAHVIIRCPRTGSNVQVWVPEDASTHQPDAYEAVTCPACTRLHFVNKTTGKLLGDK